MAFPLEPSQLRAQQRAFCLATSENEHDSTSRIIKPLTSGLFYEQCNEKYFDGFRPSSPEIPVDLPDTTFRNTLAVPSSHHKRHSSRATNRNSHIRRKSRIATVKAKEPVGSTSKLETLDFQDASLATESFAFQEPVRSVTKKNPLTKLFVKSDKSRQRSDSESTISRSSLVVPEDSFDNTSGSVAAIDTFGDFSESDPSATNSLEGLTDEEEYISDGIETLDNKDASNCSEESLNSAFTDIEADSMIDGSSDMMYDYTVPDTSVLRNDAENNENMQRPNDKLSISNLTGPIKKGLDESGIDRATPLLRKRESFSFPKVHTLSREQPAPKSKLSIIIQTRHTSSNANPLAFFSYSGADSVEGVRKAAITIFVPPKTTPTLDKLPVAGNMAVFDCIGFILLKLSEKENNSLKESELSFNPNHWRLELTDEDGELYDANFGVLDRTRLISSYNYPKYLALCKVKTQAEITHNEKQSPLPLEFKQNLELFEERARSVKENETEIIQRTEHWDLAAPGGKSIEVKVKNIPSTSKVISFFVASEMLVGDLLDLICRQYRVDATKFKLSGFQVSAPKKETSLLNDKDSRDEGHTIPLQNTQALSETHVDYFKMDPIVTNTIRSMLDVKAKRSSFLEAGITPNSSAFALAGITPPVAQIENKNQEVSPDQSTEEKDPETVDPKMRVEPPIKPSKKNAMPTSGASIDKLIIGSSSQLPTSLNTFYCKWKVFRKKAPLIYRIEKSLIIDGDYIHLAPTDDTNWKSFHDNPISGASQSGNHHHHHYLHHYNYSKYYNDTMLKTSSFHISQIVKLKSYKDSKSPTHFKIVIKKEGESGGKETVIKKKYDLEAETVEQCDDIFEKIKWALQLYNASNAT